MQNEVLVRGMYSHTKVWSENVNGNTDYWKRTYNNGAGAALVTEIDKEEYDKWMTKYAAQERQFEATGAYPY